MRYLQFLHNVIFLGCFFAAFFWLMKLLHIYIDKDYFVITSLIIFLFLKQDKTEGLVAELHCKWVKDKSKGKE